MARVSFGAPQAADNSSIAGAAAARGDWFLFLHADTVLDAGWREEVHEFQGNPENATMAATFRFALDDACTEAKRLEGLVAWRVRSSGCPMATRD